MKKETIPIGELKLRLMRLAESGNRINHLGSCLFSGFNLNQNWTARGPVLRERLEKYVIDGAKFEVMEDTADGDDPISNWVTIIEYTACKEPIV